MDLIRLINQINGLNASGIRN